jgi:hypothetical protein
LLKIAGIKPKLLGNEALRPVFSSDKKHDQEIKSHPNFHRCGAGIGFMLKRSREWYGQGLFCKTVGDHFDCFLEGDGG